MRITIIGCTASSILSIGSLITSYLVLTWPYPSRPSASWLLQTPMLENESRIVIRHQIPKFQFWQKLTICLKKFKTKQKTHTKYSSIYSCVHFLPLKKDPFNSSNWQNSVFWWKNLIYWLIYTSIPLYLSCGLCFSSPFLCVCSSFCHLLAELHPSQSHSPCFPLHCCRTGERYESAVLGCVWQSVSWGRTHSNCWLAHRHNLRNKM